MSYSKKLPIGSLGICHSAIAKDKWGEAFIHYIPAQAKDKWEVGTYKIQALEDIRENRDIIVVNANCGAIEHTPQELKYMTRAEQWQRVDEEHPLPITTGTKAVTWTTIVATALGNTLLAAPTVATKKIRVHYFSYSNAHNVITDVGMRMGPAGTIRHRFSLPANGGAINGNLIDANWEGADGESLFAVLGAAAATGIYISVGYEEVE